jgi:starvation-inducible DNA-binding protein
MFEVGVNDALDDLAAFLLTHAYDKGVADAERLELFAAVTAFQDGIEPRLIEAALRKEGFRFRDCQDYRAEWAPPSSDTTKSSSAIATAPSDPVIDPPAEERMTTTDSQSYLPALDLPHERERVGRELEGTLHELLDLALIGKQLHWTVIGALFRPVHLQLDELVDACRDLADTVAERAVALGYAPDGQARAIVAGSGLDPVSRGPIDDKRVLHEITHRVATVSEQARARMNRLGDFDAASQDVLIEVVRTLEKQQWMLRAQLDDHH